MDTSKEKLYRDVSWLAGEYVTKRKSLHQIRREYGWGINTIKRWLKKHKIKTRQLGDPIVSIQQGKDKRINIDRLGYSYLHCVMRKEVPNFGKCAGCNKKTNRLDCANISGEYKQEPSDWKWLCRGCHVKSDGRVEKMLDGRYL